MERRKSALAAPFVRVLHERLWDVRRSLDRPAEKRVRATTIRFLGDVNGPRAVPSAVGAPSAECPEGGSRALGRP